MKKYFISLFLIFYLPLANAEVNTNIQQQIVNFVDQNQAPANQLLMKLVNIDSQTSNQPGVRAVGSVLQKQFEKLGFKTYWETMPKNMQRAGNLLAVKKGTNGKRVLLIGHLDTVFSAKAMQPSYQLLANNQAKGVGVSDMKGGDVVILYALKALQAVHALDNATIMVALIGDEENSGQPIAIASQQLINLAKQSDVALDFESGPPSIGRRGITAWNLIVQGKQGHSSLIFQPTMGVGAIFEIARILNSFREQLGQEADLSFNPALILAGTQISFHDATTSGTASSAKNIIPSKAVAAGDLRFITEQQKIAAEQRMQKIVQANLPQTSAVITFRDLIPAMPPTEKNKQLLQQLNNINLALGYGAIKPLEPALRGAGDISYIAALVPAELAGMGPIGQNEHSIQETIDLNSIPITTKRAALLIYSLIKAP